MKTRLASFLLTIPALVSLGLVLYFLLTLVVYSIPAFATGSVITYPPSLPSIYGSIVISVIAVILAAIFSISLAIVINEFLPPVLDDIVSTLIDMMAAFPTVIFGLWGLLVFSPYFRKYVEYPLYKYLGFLPPFSYPPVEPKSALLTGVVLGIMVTPFATAVIREAYRAVPIEIRETVLSLGGGKWEIVKITLSYIKEAIIGGLTLSFGKAIGETAAVAILIGGVSWFCPLTAPCNAIPALIANRIQYAMMKPELIHVFAALALILFALGSGLLFIVKKIIRGARI